MSTSYTVEATVEKVSYEVDAAPTVTTYQIDVSNLAGPEGLPGGAMTLADNGDGTATLAWNDGANSAKIAVLTVGALLPTAVIPAIALTIPTVVADEAAMLALTAQAGDVAIRSDLHTAYMLAVDGDPATLADWLQISQPGGVTSVNSQTGVIVLAAADVGALPSDDARVAPSPTSGDAGKVMTVKDDGSGYELDTPTAGSLTAQAEVPANATVTLTSSYATYQSATFAAGTWLIMAHAAVYVDTGGNTGDDYITAVVGSGTGTITGPSIAVVTRALSQSATLSLAFVLTCTTACTVNFQAKSTGTSHKLGYGAGTSEHTTGYAAIKTA